LLCCETAIFQYPAILVTMTVIRYRSHKKNRNMKGLIDSMKSLLLRYIVVISIGVSYIAGRFYFDSLDIPISLIRPAENPFYPLTGFKRFMNYSMILSFHVWKSLAFYDPVGRSHEYGFNCIPEVNDWNDPRILWPILTLLLFLLSGFYFFMVKLDSFLLWAMIMSWYITLYPVSGLTRVGTFVADRICFASTVPFAIFAGYFASKIRLTSLNRKNMILIFFVSFSIFTLGQNVFYGTLAWMTNLSLHEQSMLSCPNSAKGNLEMAKMYSGAYPDLINMTISKSYTTKAETIDPNFCDVHKQWALILFHENKYLEFEDRLTKSVLCDFTSHWGLKTFHEYWEAIIQENDPRVGGRTAIKRRAKHVEHIRKTVENMKEEEEKKKL